MRKSRFTEDHVIALLREREAGVASAASESARVAWRGFPQGMNWV